MLDQDHLSKWIERPRRCIVPGKRQDFPKLSSSSPVDGPDFVAFSVRSLMNPFEDEITAIVRAINVVGIPVERGDLSVRFQRSGADQVSQTKDARVLFPGCLRKRRHLTVHGLLSTREQLLPGAIKGQAIDEPRRQVPTTSLLPGCHLPKPDLASRGEGEELVIRTEGQPDVVRVVARGHIEHESKFSSLSVPNGQLPVLAQGSEVALVRGKDHSFRAGPEAPPAPGAPAFLQTPKGTRVGLRTEHLDSAYGQAFPIRSIAQACGIRCRWHLEDLTPRGPIPKPGEIPSARGQGHAVGTEGEGVDVV